MLSARPLAGLALACVLAACATVLPATSAQAQQLRPRGLTATLPKHLTAYNGRAVTVKPTVRVTRSTKKVVTKRGVVAYRGNRRVAAGTRVRLRPGTYRVQSRVKWYPYTLTHQWRTRTVVVHHEEDWPGGSTCTITDVDDVLGFILAADCTNSTRPGQRVRDTYTVATESGPYTVGEVVHSDAVDFPAYDERRTERYRATTRTNGRARWWTSPKTRLVVRDGGRRRVYDDTGSLTTSYVPVPKGHRSRASWSYAGDHGTCYWGVYRHVRGTPSWQDELLSNQIHAANAGTYRFGGDGPYRFAVNTSCDDWRIVVTWR